MTSKDLPEGQRPVEAEPSESRSSVEPTEGTKLKSATGRLSRRTFMHAAAASAGAAAAVGVSREAFAPPAKLDTPTITCVEETQHTIFLEVCAGANGVKAWDCWKLGWGAAWKWMSEPGAPHGDETTSIGADTGRAAGAGRRPAGQQRCALGPAQARH